MDDLYVRLQKALDEAERQARAAARKVAEHIYPPARVDGSWQPEGEVSAETLIEECGHWTAKPYLFGKAVRGGGRPGWEPWGILTGHLTRPLKSALRAVLELHKPGTFCDRVICNHCENSDESASAFIDYPCETVKVIASALGVET